MSNRLIASGELEDGTTWDDVPVTVATRVQAERTGKTNGWNTETHSMTMSAFMSWHASKSRNIHNLKWEEFLVLAVAADVDKPDATDATADSDDEDPEMSPTQTAP